MKAWYLVAAVVLGVLVVAGWYMLLGKRAALEQPADMATTTASVPAVVGTMYVAGNLLLGTDATTTLGKYLIGFNGQTVYTYAHDAQNVSTCTGACATTWSPYLVADVSVLKNLELGVTGKVSMVSRADGSLQVTYNKRPLYFYSGDKNGGDTKGNGVGGVWFVVKP